MKTLTILTVIGTRPEAVKMTPIIQKLNQQKDIRALVCITAQHREMLDQVLNLFKIKPDFDLNLMKPDQSLAQITAAIFSELDPVLSSIKPDWVLAQGDTTTVMATALLSYYHRIKFGHVEAGLRTGDKFQPFPEEVNRQVAGVVADLHFAPTEWAKQNLIKENIPSAQILVTGNPVIDALQQVARMPAPLQTRELLSSLTGKRIILVTAHRRENFGQPLINICEALYQLAEKYSDVQIVYPVHLNPNVQQVVQPKLGNHPRITLLPPLEYLPMVHLIKRATLILTDSGGLQEEAPGLGVPVLVLREVTERPEGVQAGTVRLIGTQAERIVKETCRLLDNPQAHQAMSMATNPYGDGQAAEKIVQGLIKYSS